MSVLESDTNEKIVSKSVLKYASNPEMSNPKEENVQGNSNSSISLLYKPFKYKTFLASRYSLELEHENKIMNSILMNNSMSLDEKISQFKHMKDNALDECHLKTSKDKDKNLNNTNFNDTILEEVDSLSERLDFTILRTSALDTNFSPKSSKCEISKYASFDNSGDPVDPNTVPTDEMNENRDSFESKFDSEHSTPSTSDLESLGVYTNTELKRSQHYKIYDNGEHGDDKHETLSQGSSWES